MKEQYLIEIELPIWQDPQGDVIMEKSRDYCYIYFGCWDDHNAPGFANYIGKIEFIKAWAIRSLDIEFYDVYLKDESRFKSSIFIVENSAWLKEVYAIRDKYYNDNWTGWKKVDYKHYLVKGHDNYFEIIATDFKLTKIDKAFAGKYAYLIEENNG